MLIYWMKADRSDHPLTQLGPPPGTLKQQSHLAMSVEKRSTIRVQR